MKEVIDSLTNNGADAPQAPEGSASGIHVIELPVDESAFVLAVASGAVKPERVSPGWAEPNSGQFTGEVKHKKFGGPNYLK